MSFHLNNQQETYLIPVDDFALVGKAGGDTLSPSDNGHFAAQVFVSIHTP